MSPLRHAADRLSTWIAISPPESFTYRSFLRYVLRAVPRYGVGPALVVGYQVATHGWTHAVLYTTWLLSALATSLVGFALVRRDPGYAAVAGTSAAGLYWGLYAWLPAAGLGRWLVVFVAGFGVLSAGGGVVAATR